jgi:hypothetical protein
MAGVRPKPLKTPEVSATVVIGPPLPVKMPELPPRQGSPEGDHSAVVQGGVPGKGRKRPRKWWPCAGDGGQRPTGPDGYPPVSGEGHRPAVIDGWGGAKDGEACLSEKLGKRPSVPCQNIPNVEGRARMQISAKDHDPRVVDGRDPHYALSRCGVGDVDGRECPAASRIDTYWTGPRRPQECHRPGRIERRGTGRPCFGDVREDVELRLAIARQAIVPPFGKRLRLAHQTGTRSPHILCQASAQEAGMHDALIRLGKGAVCYHVIESDESERGRR